MRLLRVVPRVVVASLCSVPLSGCDSGTPAGPPPPALSVGADAKQSVTGSGHFLSAGEIRTFTVSAIRHADGSVSGNYHVNVHAVGLKVHVSVECMLIRPDGKTARVGGTITKSNDPARPEGTKNYFWLVDNGEGPDAPPDIVSLLGLGESQEELDAWCAGEPGLLDNFPSTVLQGNIQVRP